MPRVIEEKNKKGTTKKVSKNSKNSRSKIETGAEKNNSVVGDGVIDSTMDKNDLAITLKKLDQNNGSQVGGSSDLSYDALTGLLAPTVPASTNPIRTRNKI